MRRGEPAPVRFQIHRAELPLPQRVVDAREKALLLLLLADLQPEFDENDASVGDVFLDFRTDLRKRPTSLGLINPMTFSTPARLYQLRSKMTISPAAGKRPM
jgi:hypothetical protein